MSNDRLPRHVRRLFRHPWRTAASIAKEVDDEVRFHLEMRATELRGSGLDAEAANAEAWRSFGSAAEVREHALSVNAGVVRRARVAESISGVVQDVRFALRQARRTPLFTGVAVATLALGIGANSAIFSVVHHVLISPLPFADGNRLAWLTRVGAQGHILVMPDAPLVAAWRSRAHSLEAIGAASEGDYEIRDRGNEETVKGGAVSANLMPLLGVRPALGRDFEPRDERHGAVPVAMLGYEEWQTRFGGRSDVIGRAITVDSVSRVIVGVAPAGLIVPFTGSEVQRGLWLPLGNDGGQVITIGKVRKGVAIETVDRELSAIAAQVSAGTPFATWGAKASRAQDLLGKSLRKGLLLLFGAVGMVLLIACANVANLLLVRASTRKRELAIRTALGAGRARLIRQLVAESLTIAAVGGAAGLALAWAGVHVFVARRPPGLDDLSRVRIEPPVLAWTLLVTIATGLLFGLAPAVFATAHAMTDGLKAGARATETPGAARALRPSIIVAEIALSVFLLISAGLLVRSFREMQHADLGFDPRGLTKITVSMGRATPPERRRAVAAALLRRLRDIPGIHGAVLGGSLPPQLGVSAGGLQAEGGAASASPRIGVTGFVDAQPGFFRTAGISLRGRTFNADTTGLEPLSPNEIIINERLARRLWPTTDAIGQRVRLGTATSTVVGVARDLVIPGRSGDMHDLQLYVPWFSMNAPTTSVVFRSDLDSHATAAAIHQAMASVSAQLQLTETQTSDEELRAMLAPAKFATALTSAFAVLALLLSVVGLYGVIAYAVSQRIREIGVRIALGAQPNDIARLVVVRGAVLAGAGLVGGIVLSTAGSRLLRAYLYGVSEQDPVTYAAIVTLLGGVALLAVYLPARRAMRVDPVVALSSE